MQPSGELKDVLVRFYDALAQGDLSVFDRHFSSSPVVRGIGTDPDEWWSGTRLAEVWKEQLEAMGGRMPLEPGPIEAFVEGDVGWVADQPTLDVGDGNRVRIRYTAVFHRENGDWKLVQSHGSIGIPNEQSIGELPT